MSEADYTGDVGAYYADLAYRDRERAVDVAALERDRLARVDRDRLAQLERRVVEQDREITRLRCIVGALRRKGAGK